MSKNKFFKKLLVAGLCALTATATVGTVVTVAGCKKDDGNESEQTREYTVKYDLDGGTWSNANSVKVKDGEKVTKPSNPTKTGYTFVKWIDASDKTDYDFDAKVESDLTLKAVWQVVQGGEVTTKYTVTIDLDGGTWGDNSLSIEVEKDGTLGDALAVAGVSALPTKAGHEFKGWITTSGDAYETDTPVTADITIKASWEAAHQHEWATEWTKDANGHYKAATCNVAGEGCDVAKTEVGNHKDADVNNVCDDCGYEVTGLPEGYTALHNKENVTKILDNTFMVADELPEFVSAGTAGIYSTKTATHYTKIENGVATLVNPGNGPVNMFADFGTPYGTIEGYFEFTPAATAGMTPIQFYGESGTTEIFGLRMDGSELKYRLNASSTYVSGTNKVTLAAGTAIKVGFTFECTTNEITVVINGQAFTTQTLPSNIRGIKFAAQDSGSVTFSVDNLIVVYTPASLDNYKANTAAKYDAVNALIADYEDLDVSAAQEAYTTAMAAATVSTDCDDAYNTYYAAVLTALKQLTIGVAEVEYPASDYTRTENQADYQQVMTDGKAAVNGAKTIEKVIEKAEEWGTKLGELHPDSYYDQAEATVTISDGTNTWTLSEVDGVKLRVTDEVTKAMLDATVVVPSGSTIEGYYSSYAGGEYTNPLTLPMTLESETATIYVKFATKTEQHETFNVDDLTDGEQFAKGATIYDGTSIKIENHATAGGATKKVDCGAGEVSANDSSNLKFTAGLMPTGGGRVYVVTAKTDVTIVVYYTIGDGKFESSETAAKKSDQLTWTKSDNTKGGENAASDHYTNIAYAHTITLTEGQHVEITAANRLVLFGVVTTYMA